MLIKEIIEVPNSTSGAEKLCVKQNPVPQLHQPEENSSQVLITTIELKELTNKITQLQLENKNSKQKLKELTKQQSKLAKELDSLKNKQSLNKKSINWLNLPPNAESSDLQTPTPPLRRQDAFRVSKRNPDFYPKPSPPKARFCDICYFQTRHLLTHCPRIAWSPRVTSVPPGANASCPPTQYCYAHDGQGHHCIERGHYSKHCVNYEWTLKDASS